MTNEHVLVFETELPIPMTCANATGIEKGAMLTLSDPMTAATKTVSNALVAGIAAEEKIASDGKTQLAVYRSGIFKAVASGSITVGDSLTGSSSATNLLETSKVNNENVWGIALETAANAEPFLYELHPMTMNLA